MTLDLEKFISNSIKTQAKIQHLDVSTKTTKSVPSSIRSIITKEYGDNYLLDADYVSFFWGKIGKEEVKKLFNVVDKALGKSANRLTDTDFKKMSMEKQDSSIETPDEDTTLDSQEEPIDQPEKEQKLDEDVEQKDSQNLDTQQETDYFFLKITLK